MGVRKRTSVCACGCGEPCTGNYKRGHNPYPSIPIADRFWSKVDKTGECWLWTAARTSAGYGVFNVTPDRQFRAHRFAYELVVGPIPEGLVMDHLCRNPPCVNPAHLEPVTNVENVMRGVSPHAQNARKERCPRGHEYSPRTHKGRPGRYCRTCQHGINPHLDATETETP